ncbi:hypothetical protein Mgra_00008764 [Meloidogyne graminicola]|uniref:Uncharacterized protein n=1 Tax=Meloidogyne graminicola TaxID=189291 RepID=A0A8S9ZEV0_9BILA|nr:hypothetical protein Mgra_00008764 [Meloidogyne graminicola]
MKKFFIKPIVIYLMKKSFLIYSNPNFENYALKFILNYLSIKELFKIEFDDLYSNNFSQYKESILELLLNKGNKFPRISINGFVKNKPNYLSVFATSFLEPFSFTIPSNNIDSDIFDLIINNIENSEDCSNMVSAIDFPYIKWYKPNLPINAKNIEKEECIVKGKLCNFENYIIKNIYNSKIKYSINQWKKDNFIIRFYIYKV